MKQSGFEFYAPESIPEAVDLLSDLGENAFVMAGGTDLLIRKKHGMIMPDAVVALKQIKGLDPTGGVDVTYSIGSCSHL